MRGTLLRVFGLMALMAMATTARAQTQITTGVIQGTVVDPQGALVQGASVEAKNIETNQSRALDSGADGRFVFLQLTSGRYVVSVKKAGFAPVHARSRGSQNDGVCVPPQQSKVSLRRHHP